jgi:hypothetical protein
LPTIAKPQSHGCSLSPSDRSSTQGCATLRLQQFRIRNVVASGSSSCLSASRETGTFCRKRRLNLGRWQRGTLASVSQSCQSRRPSTVQAPRSRAGHCPDRLKSPHHESLPTRGSRCYFTKLAHTINTSHSIRDSVWRCSGRISDSLGVHVMIDEWQECHDQGLVVI